MDCCESGSSGCGPPELTRLDKQRWRKLSAVVEVRNVLASKAAKADQPVGATVAPSLRGEDQSQKEFVIPDLESILGTVRDWQSQDRYVKAAHDYLIDGNALQENAYQTWLATVGQQLEFDEHGILYRRCPDLKCCVPDVAREVVVREAHTVPLGSHPSVAKTLE